MVLAGGESGYLQIWDLINVQEVCRITAHEGKTLQGSAMNTLHYCFSKRLSHASSPVLYFRGKYRL